MCFLCLRENPFEMIDAFVQNDISKLDETRFRAKALKIMMNVIELDLIRNETCHIGDATIESLKEEQRKISREL